MAFNVSSLSYNEKEQLLRLLEEKEQRDLVGGHLVKIWPEEGPLSYKHYPKHIKFIEAGNEHRERFFSAANRAGKSITGAYELACHLTGLYPDWWPGKKFDHPIEAWACGDTSQTTRDIVQKELLGPPGSEGTGMIAMHLIENIRKKAGVPDAVESFKVKHISGGYSYVGFKSYDQGRRSFQGTAKHFIWCDEEVPADVYGECVVRTMTTRGLIIVTATPLKGLTPFVQNFMETAAQDETDENVNVLTGSYDE
jgi:phage terminase large subunit-like protein